MTLPSQVYYKRFVSYARGAGGGVKLNTEICICFTNLARVDFIL